MTVMGAVGLNNHENEVDEKYLHPITHVMAWTGTEHRSAKTSIAMSEGEPNHAYGSNSHNNR